MMAVDVQGLVKVYANGPEALAGVDLSVPEGEILTVVGASGCGKSTLTRVLAGDPDARVERTSGVNPRVRLIDVFEPHANALRPCFVELWDLGGREDHKPERGVLYHDLDGVVLVHDLSLSRRAPETRENLTRWAREVAASATFAAPSPDACPWRVSHTEDARGDASPHILRGGFGGVPAGDGVETSIVIRRVRVSRAVPSRADPRATVVLTRRRV